MIRLLKYSACILASLAFLSCARERIEPEAPATRTIHYRATVTEGSDTRATLNNSNQYVFQEGDRLFVSNTDSGKEGWLSGFLTLVSGAGERSAVFEGDLTLDTGTTVKEDFYLADATLSATLVSTADRIHDHETGALQSYPSDEYATSFADAVTKFSHFTASGARFNDGQFTLVQGSSFLIFNVRMKAEEEAPVGRQITARLYNNTNTLLRTATINVSEAGVVPFVFAFQGGTVSLDNAKLHLEWTEDEAVDKEKDFKITNQALAANNYYTVSRTTLKYGGFRIIALADGTITSSNIASLQYSLDEGENWQNYTTNISVQEGDEVCFRASAANNNNSKKISSNANFAIAGDILSLLIGSNFGDPSASIPSSGYTFVNLFKDCTNLIDASGLVISMPTVPGSSFKSFFEGCANLVAGPAELSATTLGSTCYRNMFLKCSSLTSAPIIRRATTHNKSNDVGGWYQRMFEGCSSLQTIVFLDDVSYSSGDFTDWVKNINATGTFYVSDTENNPFGDNRGNSAIPSNWTISNYVEPTP